MDPLGILDADLNDVHPPELELSRYGFTERDLDKQIALGPGILPHFATEDRKTMSIREIIDVCKRIYCEFMLVSESFHGYSLAQAVTSVSNTFTSRTRNSVTGFVSV